MLLLALSLSPAIAESAAGQELLEVPAVTLGSAEPAVRERLEEERRRLEESVASGATGSELAEAYGTVGELYLLYDLVEPAAAALENARRLEPDRLRWVYMLGTLHQHEGRLEEAAAAFERSLELAPGDLAATLRLAEVLLRTGDERARGLFESALRHPSGAAAAHFGLGRLAWQEEDSQAALDHFQEALRLQPSATVLHYHIGLAQRALGQEEAMRESFARRGEVEVRFEDPLVLELQADATGVGALLLLGRISRREGELDAAEERFREAVELDPTSAPARRSLGSVLEQQGKVKEAIEQYQEALRLDPDDAGRHFRVGELLATRGRDEEAADHLEQATRLAPDFFGAWIELSRARARLGRNADALEALRRVPRAGAAELLELEGLLLERLERRAEARQVLEGLLALDPERTSAALRLARLEAEAGEVEAARGRYEGLLAETSTDAERAVLHFHLGNLEAASRDEEAMEHYRRALELDPALVEASFNLGILLGRRGEYSAAAEAYGRALEADPRHEGASVGRAMSLVLAGKYAAARSFLEETLPRQNTNAPLGHVLAQLLVAGPDPEVRDGPLGLRLAYELFEAQPTTDHGETVAMGFAEVGRFEEAVAWQERLIGELEAAGLEHRLRAARRRLELYRRGEAVRSPWSDSE